VPEIIGYRELTEPEVDLINELKRKAEALRIVVEELEGYPWTDKRWLDIGKTDLQKGFMSVIRAVARPGTF
jgi:hypothetical protein